MRHSTPMNLVIEANPPEGVGIRRHITDQLRAALHRGQVATGHPLPSSRVLAASLGVSRGTVVAVYEDLAGEGYLHIHPGSGTYPAEDFTGRRRQPAEHRSSRYRTSADPAPETRTINLWPGSPSTRFQQSRAWKSAWRRALAREVPAVLPEPAGLLRTRQLIAEHLAMARGMDCHAEEIVLTAGTSDGLGILTHALMARQSLPLRVATENPGYPAARAVLSRLGAQTVPIRVRDGGMDAHELASTAAPVAAALLTPSHQYPLGGRLSISARLALLEWAEQEGAVLIEDDYDSEFRHGAAALPAIASLDTTGRVVHIGSYSKTLTPWLRCGYLVIPDAKLRKEVLAVRSELGQPVSGISQMTLAEFMSSGGLRRHLVRVGREYAHRRALVISAVEPLAPRVCLEAVESGLHAVLSWENGLPTEQVTAALLKTSIRVAPLPAYYHPDSASIRDGIVFGYGAPTDLGLRTALSAITKALSPLASSG